VSELRSICTGWAFDLTHVESCTCRWVVATLIHPEGETDTLFIEPANNIDDGCVALTEPLSKLAVLVALNDLIWEREIELRRSPS
jgi:hypothetical protein